MTEKTCCVTAHKDITPDQEEYIKKRLAEEIDSAVAQGYTNFLCGFAEGTDLYFAELVIQKQKEQEGLQLEAVIPYRSRYEKLLKKPSTKELLEACGDHVSILNDAYVSNIYMKRNHFLADHSGRVIAVYDGRQTGGTADVIRFAKALKREIQIITVERPTPTYKIVWSFV